MFHGQGALGSHRIHEPRLGARGLCRRPGGGVVRDIVVPTEFVLVFALVVLSTTLTPGPGYVGPVVPPVRLLTVSRRRKPSKVEPVVGTFSEVRPRIQCYQRAQVKASSPGSCYGPG